MKPALSFRVLVLGVGLAVIVVSALYSFGFGGGSFDGKVEAAERTAKELRLVDPSITCDPSSYVGCGCLVAHGPPERRRIDEFACCHGGCTLKVRE